MTKTMTMKKILFSLSFLALISCSSKTEEELSREKIMENDKKIKTLEKDLYDEDEKKALEIKLKDSGEIFKMEADTSINVM